MDKVQERFFLPLGIIINRQSWHRLEAADLLTGSGTIAATLARLRILAQRANRGDAMQNEQPVRPGHLIALAVIQEALRYVARYCWTQSNPGQLERAVAWIDAQREDAIADRALPAFVDLYPTPGLSFDAVGSAAEMVLLSLAVHNPAVGPLRALYDDTKLREATGYEAVVEGFDRYFADQPPAPRRHVTLMSLLRQPMRASPYSLAGQLQFILEHFSDMLPAWLLDLLMTARDVLREEEATRGLGPGPARVLSFGHDDHELERFTDDRDWMANVVLLAKSTYVWLDQLSRKYGRAIRRLDQIPNEELDTIARWGFTGLWLIGLWERSAASSDIKRRMGNPEALASAYSLWDFVIAGDLGGEQAYEDLTRRAEERGIRLAADMVPNHVGIYSKWVVEHPDWFLQVGEPPFPSYRFSGPDLSRTPGVGLRIEDGYWNHSDAAVVFERIDYSTGQRRYIYHGNDGTSMPWNDTAQLDYLNPHVREVVIQTILHVASKSPIIRFDAAMTLARRHIQRLWYPAPGDGGAIPSRSERGMSLDDFLARMPKEFWREVVDRVLEQRPDTLLLAEAFWLMEGYFVRTLGMHRVYNSAFMNMLKMEDNAKYRQTIKNVLEYSPQILKRFVNFMSNPDEHTAIEQFGREDKYFGCALLLVTMPGLPMFAHGQIEGYTERYGMEYLRAYWDEKPDPLLVARHEREIFPLMRRRQLFSQVDSFSLYDFVSIHGGHVDENVFAYSNAASGHRALVVYNNTYGSTAGWIRMSSAINVGSVDTPRLVRRSLREGLSLGEAPSTWWIFRDQIGELEYIRNARELNDNGLYVELPAYGRHVFLHWREIAEADALWVRLAHRLNGRGVPSMQEARRDLQLEPVTDAFADLARSLRRSYAGLADPAPCADEHGAAEHAAAGALPQPPAAAFEVFMQRLEEHPDVPALQARQDNERKRTLALIRHRYEQVCRLLDDPAAAVGRAHETLADRLRELRRIDSAYLLPIIAVLRAAPAQVTEDERLARAAARVAENEPLAELLTAMRQEGEDREVCERLRGFLGVNRAHEITWYNGDRMQLLVPTRRLCRLESVLSSDLASTAAGMLPPRSAADEPGDGSADTGSSRSQQPEGRRRGRPRMTQAQPRKPTAAARAAAVRALQAQLQSALEAHKHLQNAADIASHRWDDLLTALERGPSELAALVLEREQQRRRREQAARATVVPAGAVHSPTARAAGSGQGPRIYNLFPLLVGSVADWHNHLDRIAAMGFNWVFLNPFHRPGGSGSLYAVSDYYALHPLFQADSPQSSSSLLASFCRAAERRGLHVVMDLVINHTANDSPLTTTHPDWYVRDADGGLRCARAVDPDDPAKVTVWGDLAELDYSPGAQRAALVKHWQAVVQHHAALGIRGFRCDAAYQVPGEVWTEILTTARDRGESVFFAETLGCQPQQVQQLALAKFDYLFNSSKWWDFRQDWLLEQYEQFRHLAPSVSFPESHDTSRLVCQVREQGGGHIDSDTVAQHYRLRFLFAAFFSSGVMMPVGYEFGFERPLHVVRTRPDDWETPRFDLQEFVQKVHAMKSSVPALNEEGPQSRLSAAEDPVVALLRQSHRAQSHALALINPSPTAASAVDVARLWQRASLPPPERFTEITPGVDTVTTLCRDEERVRPLSMRVFAAGGVS